MTPRMSPLTGAIMAGESLKKTIEQRMRIMRIQISKYTKNDLLPTKRCLKTLDNREGG
jgi:hypothetical protein